jgi:hypothetical protein
VWTYLPDGGCFTRVGSLLVQVASDRVGGWRWLIAPEERPSTIIREGWCANRHDAQAEATQAAEGLRRGGAGQGDRP